MDTIQLDLIKIDGKTQHRDVVDDVVNLYAEAMADGAEFPPVELIHDGKVFYLWDGFHRYFANLRNKNEHINANVKNGTVRDARWLSFGANKLHGFQRQQGTVKNIIMDILSDEEWAKTSLTEIARHIGATVRYVREIKSDMESAMVGTVPTIERSETVEVTRNGTTYEQKSQESQYRDPKPILDKENNPLNGDTAELYLRNRAFLQRHINTLNEIDREVKKLIADKDIAIAFVNPSSFHSDFMNLKGVLQNGLLHALCPYCFQYTGEECPACRKTGMLSKLSYDSAPEDWRMKDGVRMAAEPKPIENDEDF